MTPDAIPLTTQRLLLRPLTPADLDHLAALDSDPAVMRYLSGGAPTLRAVIARDILPRFLALDGGFGCWLALDRAGDVIGWFLLRPGAPGDASLGYRLKCSAWGKGYATEGARALIQRAFADLGVQRITAITYQDNLPSRRVLEKLGFTLVRRYHLDPDDLKADATYDAGTGDLFPGDDLEYALPKEEWDVAAGPV